MFFKIILLAYLLKAWVCQSSNSIITRSIVPDEKYYDQKLNHFDVLNKRTWKQRYWVDETIWDRKGPVFLYIGGQLEMDPEFVFRAQWIVYAKQFNALCVLLEHRYYGKSQPTTNTAKNNLRHLSIEQTLEDLATFRQFIQDKFNLTNSNKWVGFGSSYAGTLAAWFRLKYPHLLDIAISSSAPLLFKVDFYEYLEVTGKSLDIFKSGCSSAVAEATAELIDTLKKGKSGIDFVKQSFRLCDTLLSLEDQHFFYLNLLRIFMSVVQYNMNFGAIQRFKRPNMTIDDICTIMLNGTTQIPLFRLINLNNITLDLLSKQCIDSSFFKLIQNYRNVSWIVESDPVLSRLWLWQMCNQFGIFISTSSQDQPFYQFIPLEFLEIYCIKVFGPEYTINNIQQLVDRTNTKYGGQNYRGSKVIFVNGKIDPWYVLSFIQPSLNDQVEVILLEKTAHTADMYTYLSSDPPELVEAREKISGIIRKWI